MKNRKEKCFMRKLFAIWAAKLSAIAGKLLGKGSSAGPGTIALSGIL